MGDVPQVEIKTGDTGAGFDAAKQQQDFLNGNRHTAPPTNEVALQTDARSDTSGASPDPQELNNTTPDENSTPSADSETKPSTDPTKPDDSEPEDGIDSNTEQDDLVEEEHEPLSKEDRVQSMVDTIIIQKGKKAGTAKKFDNLPPAEKAAYAYRYYSESKQIVVSREKLRADPPLKLSSGIDGETGATIFHASPTGETVQEITGSSVGDNGLVMCQCRIGKDIVSVPAREIAAAYLMANKDTLGKLFPTKDSKAQDVFAAHVGFLNNRSGDIAIEEGTIDQAAKDLKLTSAEHVTAILITFGADEKKIDDVMNMLGGQLYTDAPTMARILYALDFQKEPLKKIDGWIAELQSRSAPTAEEGMRNQQMIEHYRQERESLSKQMSKVGENKDSVIKNLESAFGNMDANQFSDFIGFVGTGRFRNDDEAMNALLDHIPADKKEMAMQILKVGGIGAAALLVLMIMQGMQGGK